MKHVKMLGLAALSACAMMVFVGVGTASATELLCAGAVVCKTGTNIVAKSEKKAKLTFAGGMKSDECEVEYAAKTTNEGDAVQTVAAKVEALQFKNCTAGALTVLALGTVEVHTEEANNNNNGTLTSTGTEFTYELMGLHCVFKTNATSFGTLTGSATTKGAATLDLNATIPRTAGKSGVLCGANGTFTGAYEISEPNPLNVR